VVYIGERGTSDAPKKSPKKVTPRRMGLSAMHSIALASHDEGLPTNRGKDRMLIDSKPTRKDNHMSCLVSRRSKGEYDKSSCTHYIDVLHLYILQP